jgi:hypothetical protein
MYALAPRRCQHCLRVLATVPLDRAKEFDVHGRLMTGTCRLPRT